MSNQIRVVISGRYFDHRDLKYVRNGSLSVKCFPKPELISTVQIRSLRKACQDADLLIIAMFGSSPSHLLKYELDTIAIPKAFWSWDSHHYAEQELRFARKFNRLFIAHSPYLDKFKGFLAEWMPCCYYRYGIDDLKRIVAGLAPRADRIQSYLYYRFRQCILRQQAIDIAFPHKTYSIGNRKELVSKIVHLVEARGLRILCNPVKSGRAYMETLRKARVVLNISLIDDLNLRNFEAWALNRVLLANKVPDHDRIWGINLSHTYLFSRDLSGLEEALDAALADSGPVNTFYDIINGHMLIHRYIDIINRCLGTKLEVVRFS